MSNLASNPWSFVPGDVDTAAITSVALNADGTVTLTCTGAPTTPYVANQFVTLVGVTNALYNGFYMVITATSTTVYQLAPQPWVPNRIPAGTASSSGGNVLLNQYNAPVRVEDLSWQNVGTSAVSMDVRDRNGNVIWQASIPAATTSQSQNRGKIMWVWGISLFLLPSGILLVTVN